MQSHRSESSAVSPIPRPRVSAPGRIPFISKGPDSRSANSDGSVTDRVNGPLGRLCKRAGFKAPVLENIRSRNLAQGVGQPSRSTPSAPLTHATLVDICRFPAVARSRCAHDDRGTGGGGQARHLLPGPAREANRRAAERVGKHKTSMLQDAEVGKALETEALVGAVVELGRLTGTPTPSIDAVYALTRLLGHVIVEDRVRIRAESLATGSASDPRRGRWLPTAAD